MNKQTVLITGANGFLGRNLLQAFVQQTEFEVIAACRQKSRLPEFFHGEIREGDLRDTNYRQSVVQGVDIICHTGTWAAMWAHTQQEKENFYEPTIALIEQANAADVRRFLMTSTVAVCKSDPTQTPIDDFAEAQYTGFWPHLDCLIDIEKYMQAHAGKNMQMTSMRLGHFVGASNKLGIVPALLPRLKSHLVPWLAGGKSQLPLISDTDLANSFIKASLANDLKPYESFNICGTEFPTTREVISYIVQQTGLPAPHYSVPYTMGYLFALLMEKLYPILPGKAPFLTRSIVYLAEHRICNTQYAEKKLGYRAQKHWKVAIDEAIAELKQQNYPWTPLSQN